MKKIFFYSGLFLGHYHYHHALKKKKSHKGALWE